MEDYTYEVSYDKILESNTSHHVVIDLVKRIIDVPYMTVGEFIRGLNDEDLRNLIATGESIKNDEESFDDEEDEEDEDVEHEEIILTGEPISIRDYALIGIILVGAEHANITINRSNISRIITSLTTFLIVEYLDRQGLAVAVRKNMSFDEEMDHSIIAYASIKK